MRISLVCRVGLALLMVVLAGCGDAGDGKEVAGGGVPSFSYAPDGSSPTASEGPTIPPDYQVPDSACPPAFGFGLTISTDVEAEIEYLDDIVACSNATGTATYLRNGSDAVWTLHNLGRVDGTVQPLNRGAIAQSFHDAVQSPQPLMSPQDVLTIDLPPESIRWDIDLPLSIGWEGHQLVVEKIRLAGEAAVIAALRRTSRAGAALVACTVGLAEYAKNVEDLPDADFGEVVLTGLGTATAASRCREAALHVPPVVDPATGRVVSLSDEIARLSRQTAAIEAVESRVGWVARGLHVLKFGIRFGR